MIPSILPTYNRYDLAFERGEGSWAITTDGRRFLDLAAGIAVNSLGHANPELVAALTEQAGKIWHVSNLYRIPEQEKLAQLLTDNSFADTVFFTNSGTEAAELAIKMVRRYWWDKGQPERIEIVTLQGAFHGRSTGAIAAAGSEKMVKGFGPLMPGFTAIPFGDEEALKAAITENTAAVMLETVQGEGGIRTIPDQLLKDVRKLCDETGALLILDEVQCGMGRTGRLFAYELAGIEPDLMMVAKGIGGGFPLGALLATNEAGAAMIAGTHGSTYGGNPLACAVGIKVMEIITGEGFLEEVRRKGLNFSQKLEGLVASHPDVFEAVRGEGLMLGLKCKLPAGDVVAAASAEGLLIVPAADDVVRILPPLNISDEDLAEAVARLDRAAVTLKK